MRPLAFVFLVLALVACAEQVRPEEASPTAAPPAPDATPAPTPRVFSPQDLEPRPDDLERVRGPVYDLKARLMEQESFPPQYLLTLEGALPTPCHQVRALVQGPQDGSLWVQVYSVSDRDTPCLQMLQPFRVSLPLGTLQRGTRVLVNGKLLGTVGE